MPCIVFSFGNLMLIRTSSHGEVCPAIHLAMFTTLGRTTCKKRREKEMDCGNLLIVIKAVWIKRNTKPFFPYFACKSNWQLYCVYVIKKKKAGNLWEVGGAANTKQSWPLLYSSLKNEVSLLSFVPQTELDDGSERVQIQSHHTCCGHFWHGDPQNQFTFLLFWFTHTNSPPCRGYQRGRLKWVTGSSAACGQRVVRDHGSPDRQVRNSTSSPWADGLPTLAKWQSMFLKNETTMRGCWWWD